MERRNVRQVMGGVGCLSLALVALVQADCLRLHTQATEALKEHNLQQLTTLYEQAAGAPDCDDAFRQALRGAVALAYTSAAQAAAAQGHTGRVRDLSWQALQYENVWQARALLGDSHHTDKDYGKAAVAYQEALDLIQEVKEPPAVTIIQALYRKTEESRLLAPGHIPLTRHRSTGQFAGVGAVTFRGFQPAARMVPITFVFDSTAFDSKGSEAAAELARLFQERPPAAVALLGHTDPVGDDTYNLHLSQRRAEALKTYLQQTYRGPIRTEGKGEREPYQPMNDQPYSQDELYRLHRRVELRLE